MNNKTIQWMWNPLFLVFSLMIFMVGCSAQAAAPSSEGNGVPMQYQILKPPYSLEISKALEEQKQTGGTKTISQKGNTIVAISLGQRPSAGYKVIIKKVEKKGDSLIVQYSEQKPQGMALTVISYPSLVIQLPETNYSIKTEKVTS